MKILNLLFLIWLMPLIALIGLFFSWKISETQPTTVDAIQITNSINEYRQQNGLDELVVDQELCKLAETRLKDIQTDFSHDNFKSEALNYFDEFYLIGENLAEYQTSVDQLVNQWVESPTHKQNILYNYDKTCVRSESFKYVQVFGSSIRN